MRSLPPKPQKLFVNRILKTFLIFARKKARIKFIYTLQINLYLVGPILSEQPVNSVKSKRKKILSFFQTVFPFFCETTRNQPQCNYGPLLEKSFLDVSLLLDSLYANLNFQNTSNIFLKRMKNPHKSDDKITDNYDEK